MNNKKSKKIFNWGWYGFENFGDDLLQNTMIEKILDHPQAEICFAMNRSYSFQDNRISQCKRTYINLMKSALSYDCLIVGPGGLFPFQNTAKCILMYLIILLWSILGKKIIFFGIGISPQMNCLNILLWRMMIRHCDLFLTRSNGMIDAIGLKETYKVHTMADVAFASNAIEKVSEKSCEIKKIGIAVANISNGVEAVYKEFVQIWTDAVKYFIKCGFKVDLIAFTKGADDMLIRDIYNNIAPAIHEEVCTSYYEHIKDTVKTWSEYDQVVCMRFHALVLSILAGVPPVPIAYGEKTSRLAERCGLSDYLLSWNPATSGYFGELTHITSSAIIEKSIQVLNDCNVIQDELSRNRREFSLSAERAFSELMDCCFQ